VQILVLSAYISSTQDIAYVVATVYVLSSMLWTGVLVPLRDLLPILRAFSYITPCRYALQIIVRQQFMHTSKQSTLAVFDLLVPDAHNFAALLAIYAALLGISLLALRQLCHHSAK
jgi:ABC-type multidrug transport system permease subunit